jgi:uncharacterized damage-inducible protein DinB
MIQHFKRLFEYDLWANKQTIEVITKDNRIDSKSELLFSHILNSQQIWYSRIMGNTKGQTPWDIIPYQSFSEIAQLINEHWKSLLKEKDVKSLRKTIEYKNMQGEKFSNTLEDILTHILNHSTYHRAQISAHLKSSGKNPPITDYIAFARKK